MKIPKRFQRTCAEAISDYFQRSIDCISEFPHNHENRNSKCSAVLLEAPTGIGKTFIAIQAINEFSSGKRTVWFWFSPWSHLCDQTAVVLKEEALNLRVADLSVERNAAALSGSIVYSLVWASLAAKGDAYRKNREADDGKQRLSDFIADARSNGYQIGVVIDEAHHGLRGSSEAGRLVKETLRPDYLLFISATPDDKDISELQKYLNLTHIHHVVASRQNGIDANLIKPDVKIVYFRDAVGSGYLTNALSLADAGLALAVQQHNRIKANLTAAGIQLTPLLLVQVGSVPTVKGVNTPVEEARLALIKAGIKENAIRVHTSKEPDPQLNSIAADQTVEALIFKMAVATGFDAPRAFILASMRTTKSDQFGLQLLGRILRVPHQLQSFPSIPKHLENGYVFLLETADAQVGLVNAANRIKELKAGAWTFTNVSSIETADGATLVEHKDEQIKIQHLTPHFWTQKHVSNALPEDGLEYVAVETMVIHEEFLTDALNRTAIVRATAISAFGSGATVNLGNSELEIDHSKITRRALKYLERFDELDTQKFLIELVRRLTAEYLKLDLMPTRNELLHVACLISCEPQLNAVEDALQRLRSTQVSNDLAEILPEFIVHDPNWPASPNNLYGLKPTSTFDSPEERRFVEGELEREDVGLIWWHRNLDRKSHSIGLARPSGGMYFPDFCVNLTGLQVICTQDTGIPEEMVGTKCDIGLLEVKGLGWLNDSKVKEAFSLRHPVYGRPAFVTEVKGNWHLVQADESGDLVPGPRFSWPAFRKFIKS
jgi:superfamily II DNA or RNA helicase